MKIVIIASFAPSIINFRRELIIALGEYAEITVLAPYEDDQTTKDILALGVRYKTFFLKSRGLNPWNDLKTKRELINLIKDCAPDVVFSYTIKPVIWGSIAAHHAGVKKSYAMIEGLGYAFTDTHHFHRKLIQKIAIWLYKRALAHNNAIFFLNPDDQHLFSELNIIKSDKKRLILNGCGVDLKYYEQSIPVVNPIKFLMIARLLKDKGLLEFIEAAKIIKQLHPTCEFHLVGYTDSNPASITQNLLEEWINQKLIVFHGKLADVRPIIRSTNVYVLPSYREGTPRSVMEAMSMGRPIITTDAPGCRETVIDGYNGFLIPVKNVDALVEAMQKMIKNPSCIESMGMASRALAERKYNVHHVNQVILKTMDLV